jgi:hypothetical protein
VTVCLTILMGWRGNAAEHELIDNRIERDRKVCEANSLILCPVRGPGESLDLNNFVIPNNAVMR